MGRQEIIDRILSDARAEADEIESAARERADRAVAQAEREAAASEAEAAAEAEARALALLEGRRAAARLDGKKLLLAERRRVIAAIYARALDRLIALDEKETLALSSRLLEENAETGDTVVFARNYPYAEGVARLSVVKERSLGISPVREDLSGGFLLRGEKADKDLTYGALLAADREANQSEIFRKLFGNRPNEA